MPLYRLGWLSLPNQHIREYLRFQCRVYRIRQGSGSFPPRVLQRYLSYASLPNFEAGRIYQGLVNAISNSVELQTRLDFEIFGSDLVSYLCLIVFGFSVGATCVQEMLLSSFQKLLLPLGDAACPGLRGILRQILL